MCRKCFLLVVAFYGASLVLAQRTILLAPEQGIEGVCELQVTIDEVVCYAKHYNALGELVNVSFNNYLQNGQRVDSMVYEAGLLQRKISLFGHPVVRMEHHYKYQADNQLKSMHSFYNELTTGSLHYTYSDYSKTEINRDAGGDTLSVTNWQYRSDGQVESMFVYRPNGRSEKCLYQYNNLGQQVQCVWFDAADQPYQYRLFEYNASHQLVAQLDSVPGLPAEGVLYSYKKGAVAKSAFFEAGGGIYLERKFKYQASGKLVECVENDYVNNRKRRIKYRYVLCQ